jgi:hypothetical protein
MVMNDTMCDQSGMVVNKISDHVGATEVLVRYIPKEAAAYSDADNDNDPDYAGAS